MLDELLKRSREATAKRGAGAPDAGDRPTHWAIVACMSCPMNDYLQNLVRGDAVIIRNAGGVVTPWDNGIIRSLAAAVYVVGVKEIAVIGHTDCRMRSDVAPLTDALAKYGTSREVFKDVDLREWFGLIATEEIALRKTVDAIRQSPMIPRAIPVYGLMMDSTTGDLREVYSPKQEPATVAPTPAPSEATFKATEVLPPEPPKASEGRTPPPLPKQRFAERKSAEEKMKELRDMVRKMDRR